MYCSQECHDYGVGKEMCASENEYARVFCMYLQILNYFNEDLGKILGFIEDPIWAGKTIFDFDMSDPNDPDNFLHQFISLNTLKKSGVPEKFESLLETHPIYLRWEATTERDAVRKILNFLVSVAPNALGYDWWKLRTAEKDFDSTRKEQVEESMVIGKGIFLFASFFNHSCFPNVERFAVENKLVIFVRTPIKKGEQLYISYG